MKNKKEIALLLSQISDLIGSKEEHQEVINFAVNLGLIYGQKIQVDVTDKDLKLEGITFGEYGTGIIIANALKQLPRKKFS